MYNKIALLATAALALSVASGNASAAPLNLLENPGFETGDFSGFVVGGTASARGVATDGTDISALTFSPFSPTYTNVRTGTYASYAFTAGSEGEFVTFEQTVSVLAGEIYDAGFYVGSDSRSSGYGYFASIYVDGLLIGGEASQLTTGSGPDDFDLVTGTYTALADALVTVQYRFSGSGTARGGFSFDDFYFTGEAPSPVPEPATLAMLGLGLAGVGLARRRSARA